MDHRPSSLLEIDVLIKFGSVLKVKMKMSMKNGNEFANYTTIKEESEQNPLLGNKIF